MTQLLIDNSNGRTKFMLCMNGELQEERRVLPTAELSAPAVRSLLAGWQYGSALICSVVPAAQPLLQQALAPCPVRFLTAQNAPRIDFSAYAGRATLGADRVADVLGLLTYGHSPALAIDAGTAITFDLLTGVGGTPTFGGGIIAPGLHTMAEALHARTAQLPQVYAECPARAIGTTTTEAMQSGLVLGLRGMVRELITAATAELGERPFVVATGGDAALLQRLLPELIDAVDPLLTFRGLALAARA